jgi:putative GTP pyrophosphokinase
MPNIEQLRKLYDQYKDRYNKLKDEVIYILKETIQANNIPYSEIDGRVKEFESFLDKIERKECDNPFEEITDICGVRVICLFPSDQNRIEKLIEDSFKTVGKEDKLSEKPVESFGYMSIHYKSTLLDTYSGPRYADIKNLTFEIQLRTIATHAWCSISHHLDYKNPEAVPSKLRKQFQALSALFYLADQNFESLYSASVEAKKQAKEKDIQQIRKDEINFDTLSAYLCFRYADRDLANAQAISILAAELTRAGYRTISELDNHLKNTDKAVEKVEEDCYGANQKMFHNVGMVRNALSIIDENFNKNRVVKLKNPGIERSKYKKFVESQ